MACKLAAACMSQQHAGATVVANGAVLDENINLSDVRDSFIFTLWHAEGSHQKEMRTFSVVTSEEGGELLAEAGYSCRENGYTH